METDHLESLYIVMPAYNEEETIAEVVSKWYKVLEGKSESSRLIVADSGSTDRTHALLLEMQSRYPQLVILDGTLKQHGPKLIAMYRYSYESNADYVFQTDSDDKTDPREFDAFWKRRKKYDAILGFRYNREDGKARIFVERTVCVLLKLIFRVSVPDANAPFRLMKTELLGKYVYRFAEDYNLPNIMLTTWFSYYGEKLCFRKISFRPRQGGTNSINMRKIFKIGLKAIHDFHEFKKEM